MYYRKTDKYYLNYSILLSNRICDSKKLQLCCLGNILLSYVRSVSLPVEPRDTAVLLSRRQKGLLLQYKYTAADIFGFRYYFFLFVHMLLYCYGVPHDTIAMLLYRTY